MSYQPATLKKRHSFYTGDVPRTNIPNNSWKSDVDILQLNRDVEGRVSEEYYKRYELDEIPVKDDCSFNDHSFSEGHESGTGDNKDSITNSDLDKLEIKIMSKMSQELQTDTSFSSLDSNIKLFKTTVQQIFDNFHDSMYDFEDYKNKFNEIIQRNKGDSVSELEEFISNMLQHIRSSESSISNSKNTDLSLKNSKMFYTSEIVDVIVVADNYETSSLNKTFTNNTSEDSTAINEQAEDDRLNNFLLNGTPFLKNKVFDRYLLSEMNVREHYKNEMGHLASADNIKLTANDFEADKYGGQQEHINVFDTQLDRDIPVKNSCAKKNIHLNEDFDRGENKDENKFFIFKICSYICKKLRKN